MTKLIRNELFKIIKKKSTIGLIVIWLSSVMGTLYLTSTPVIEVALDFSIINFLITILAASIMAEEFSRKTIKFLLTKTYTRSEILVSKFASLLIISVVLNFLQVIITTILGLFTTNSISFTPNSVQHVLFSIALTLCSQLLYITLTLLVSILFNSQSLAITISLLIIFLGSIINALLINQIKSSLILLNPLNMLNISALATATPATHPELRLLPLWGYLIGIFIYSGLFYVISTKYFKHKDIPIN